MTIIGYHWDVERQHDEVNTDTGWQDILRDTLRLTIDDYKLHINITRYYGRGTDVRGGIVKNEDRTNARHLIIVKGEVVGVGAPIERDDINRLMMVSIDAIYAKVLVHGKYF